MLSHLFLTIVSSLYYSNFLETAIPIFLQLLKEGKGINIGLEQVRPVPSVVPVCFFMSPYIMILFLLINFNEVLNIYLLLNE